MLQNLIPTLAKCIIMCIIINTKFIILGYLLCIVLIFASTCKDMIVCSQVYYRGADVFTSSFVTTLGSGAYYEVQNYEYC